MGRREVIHFVEVNTSGHPEFCTVMNGSCRLFQSQFIPERYTYDKTRPGNLVDARPYPILELGVPGGKGDGRTYLPTYKGSYRPALWVWQLSNWKT